MEDPTVPAPQDKEWFAKEDWLARHEQLLAESRKKGDGCELVFLGDSIQARFYKGRCVDYLPKYQPSTAMMPDVNSTFALSSDALRMIHKGNRVCEHARVVSETEAGKYWYPEDRGLTFGGKGMISVRGWFTWGMVAEVKWDGNTHVINRNSAFTAVLVNDVKVWNKPLRNGDRIKIGRSNFRYESPG